MKYYVLIKDYDPTNSNVSSLVKICECNEESHAILIRDSLKTQESNPNREYIIEKYNKIEHLILYADADQINLAWKVQSRFSDIGIHTIVCFSQEEVNMIKAMYVEYGIPHMVTVVAQTSSWATVDYDLRLGEFTEDDFETILSCLE
jgi:hypothetical protein